MVDVTWGLLGPEFLPSVLSVITQFDGPMIEFDDGPSEMKTAESTRGSSVFPLSLCTDRPDLATGSVESSNLRLDMLPANLRASSPLEIFDYIYAVLYSPAYRARYAGALSIEFPKVPATCPVWLLSKLVPLGTELRDLHLMESPKLAQPITEFIGGRHPEVEKISWSHDTVWVDKAQTIGFQGVPEEVWNFHIGGYQVCEKWLKDRKGRTLSKDDIAHYQKIVVALSETIRLMAEIDRVIDANGGWPGAFQTAAQA